MSVKVIAQINPFSQERQEFETEPCQIKDILKKIDTNNVIKAGWRVMVNDQIIEHLEQPVFDGDRLYIKVIPEGTDNKKTGKGMGWAGAALIAVGGILMYTGVGAGLGAAVIGAGVGMLTGGVALYNIDIPGAGSDREKPEEDPSIRGSRNQLRPKGYIPTLFGKRRIYSDLAMQYYTLVENGNQYLYQLFCCGQKNQHIDINTIKIEDTLLKDYSETKDITKILSGQDSLINMQIAYGEEKTPIITKCVHEYQINKILNHQTEDGIDASIIQTTVDNTEELDVDILFSSGLGKYDDKGKVKEASVEIKAEYKIENAPDEDYQLIGYFTSGEYVQIEKYVPTQSVDSDDEYDGEYDFVDGEYIYVGRWGEYDKIVETVWDPSIPTNMIRGSELKTKRYSLHKTGLTPGKYTVRITRVTADSTDSKIVDKCYVGSIRAIKNEQPVSEERCKELTLIGLKIKVSEKLNSIIEQLNFESQSILPVLNGSAETSADWSSTALSSNPASCAVYAMQGEMAQQKLKDSDIDWPAFSKLYRWCQKKEYECNAYLSESMTIQQLLSAIGSTCRAEIFRINGKITVVQDIERDSFVQIFTPRNSWDYEETISFTEIPDALAVSFNNKDSGYADDELTLYNTSNWEKADEPKTTTDLITWGVTNSKQAQRIGIYKYACSKNRPIVHSFKADIEYMLCRKGDWIKYAGDIALAGIKQGRVSELIKDPSGNIIGFQSDEIIPMEKGENYAVRIRRKDATFVQLAIRTDAGEQNKVYFTQSLLPSQVFQEGNLFLFGNPESDSVDLIITDISCEEGLTATITAVDYAPEIFALDDESYVLPEFKSNVSDAYGTVDSGEIDTEGWQTFYTFNDSQEMPESPTGDGTSGDWHRIPTNESKWQSTKIAKNINSGSWSAPVATGSAASQMAETAMQIAQGLQQQLEDLSLLESPNVWAELLGFGFSVNDAGVTPKAQQISTKVHVVQEQKEIDFYFGKFNLPAGFSVDVNYHTLTFSVEQGVRITSGVIEIPVIFRQQLHDNYYADENGIIYCDENGNTYGVSDFAPDETVSNLGFSFQGVKGGAYYGKISSEENLPQNNVIGDYFTWGGNEIESQLVEGGTFKPSAVYAWNGNQWEPDSISSHVGGPLSDVLSVANDNLEKNNSTVYQFLDHLTTNTVFAKLIATNKLLANEAIINSIFAKDVKATGSIRVGERYDETGKGVKENVAGAYLGSDGILKASKAELDNVTAKGGHFEEITMSGGIYASQGFFFSHHLNLSNCNTRTLFNNLSFLKEGYHYWENFESKYVEYPYNASGVIELNGLTILLYMISKNWHYATSNPYSHSDTVIHDIEIEGIAIYRTSSLSSARSVISQVQDDINRVSISVSYSSKGDYWTDITNYANGTHNQKILQESTTKDSLSINGSFFV